MDKRLDQFVLGDVVTIGKYEFIVLEHFKNGTTALITKDIVSTMEYGKTGDYSESNIRRFCENTVYKELCNTLGAMNIVSHTIDLEADDGTGKGISLTQSVSIPTAGIYRKYRNLLPPLGKSWWLATRPTYEANGYTRCACGVGSSGVLDWDGGVYSSGVRPFCILDSYIFVS